MYIIYYVPLYLIYITYSYIPFYTNYAGVVFIRSSVCKFLPF